VIISRPGTPVAKLVPLDRKVHRTARGSLRGRLVAAEDWDSAEVNGQIADSFPPRFGRRGRRARSQRGDEDART
jgi:antitoxin (DNA-binding transcriptional repressor) of toxin-antitoxin stability system